MRSQSGFNIYWILSILVMGLIYLFSSFPLPTELPSSPFADKLVHLLAYGVLASLIYFAREKSRVIFHPIFIPFVIAFLHGVSNEIHQHFVPGREADVFDVLADALGALVFPLGIHVKKHGRGIKLPNKNR
jgi:VanZ family protein